MITVFYGTRQLFSSQSKDNTLYTLHLTKKNFLALFFSRATQSINIASWHRLEGGERKTKKKVHECLANKVWKRIFLLCDRINNNYIIKFNVTFIYCSRFNNIPKDGKSFAMPWGNFLKCRFGYLSLIWILFDKLRKEAPGIS